MDKTYAKPLFMNCFINGGITVSDFLPSPEELALRQKNTKITISLSSESIAYFKETAKKHHMQYQKIIRQLLDEYVAHQKSTQK